MKLIILILSAMFLLTGNVSAKETPEEAYEKAKVFHSKRQYDEAIAEFTRAIGLKPDYADAYCFRGLSYHYKFQYDKAIADYNKAIELDPNNCEAYYDRGGAYVALKDYDRAISDFDKAIEINSDFAEAYFERGQLYKLKGENRKAEEDFGKAKEIDPTFGSTIDIAIDGYNKTIQANPDNPDLYIGRAMAYFEKKEYRKTWQDVRKAESLGYDVSSRQPVFIQRLREESGK